MFKHDMRFCTPSDSTIIWRYMDYYKFEDLIQNKLLFCRTIILSEDKFEASVPCHSEYSNLKAIMVDEKPMCGVRGFGQIQIY